MFTRKAIASRPGLPANGRTNRVLLPASLLLLLVLGGCVEDSGRQRVTTAQSCMLCHNGSQHDDYAGPGLEDPHPFPGAAKLQCTVCHGGNPRGASKDESHVPPPPEIGDREFQRRNPHAYFNRLTLAGIDKFADYTVNGTTWSPLDWLQFVNPGDLRVTERDRGCGQCHADHSAATTRGPLATSMGILSGATYAVGAENAIPEYRGLFDDTAADLGWRAVENPAHVHDPAKPGVIGKLIEQPVHSVRGQRAPDQIFDNRDFSAANLANDVHPDGRVVSGSRLAMLYREQVAFTCGDCHLGSAGANNRYGDFRPSGCTACHMRYSSSGRTGSRDPNVDRNEPLDPDDIDEPERAHVMAHRIASVHKTLPDGTTVRGIDDHTCAGCHQGSNRMVMQYWGIRLDQNQDVRFGFQYPANPVRFRNTANDTRLFDRTVGNRTFNGRNANQYLLFEDYDGDNRDDTPADIHYERGMGCIDCHGSVDLHGNVNDPNGGDIVSRMEQHVAIRCENCHGTADAYAPVQNGTNYQGQTVSLAVDSKGNVLRNVERDANGDYWLTSRLTGNRHYVRQTRDVVVDSGKVNPLTQAPLYSAMASFAMGRDDGSPSTGIGPQQTGSPHAGFSHLDSMHCASCHASWTNTCVGCHLEGEYNNGNNFSNITGQRIVFRQTEAQFVYQSPVPYQLGIGVDNKIRPYAANTKVFFRYRDIDGNRSQVFAFTDRNGGGNNPSVNYPSLGHNALMAHSIRGKVTATNEGPRYCVSCHLTTQGMSNFGTAYNAFRTALQNGDYGNLDWALVRVHIGLNPGNQINSPLFVHMVAGLGSGLYLFDQNGAAVNPLDQNQNRYGTDGVAPAANFSAGRVRLDLDRIVLENGVATGSSNHAMEQPGATPNRRDGATNPRFAGPLGSTLARRLADPSIGIILNAWIDADGIARGDAPGILGQ